MGRSPCFAVLVFVLLTFGVAAQAPPKTARIGMLCPVRCAGPGYTADSDEAGRLFQGEAGHLFRFHSGQCSDLKPDTLLI